MLEVNHKVKRPTSPHLQVYKLPLTALLSIAHRATGAGLSVGMVLVTAFFIAAACGEEHYNIVMHFAMSMLGKIILFMWSFALYFHTINGIRHMVWDMGYCLKKNESSRSNYMVLLLSIIVTIATWWFSGAVIF